MQPEPAAVRPHNLVPIAHALMHHDKLPPGPASISVPMPCLPTLSASASPTLDRKSVAPASPAPKRRASISVSPPSGSSPSASPLFARLAPLGGSPVVASGSLSPRARPFGPAAKPRLGIDDVPHVVRRKSTGDLFADVPADAQRRLSVSKALNGYKPERRMSLSEYHAKYDPKEVMMLRDFYVGLREDVRLIRGHPSATSSNVIDAVKRAELERKLNRSTAVRIFNGMLGKDPCDYTFRDLLAIIFPNAAEREIQSMLQLTFPDGETCDMPTRTPRVVVPAAHSEESTLMPEPEKLVVDLEKEFDQLDLDGCGYLVVPRMRVELAAMGEDNAAALELFDPRRTGRVTKGNYVTAMLQLQLRRLQSDSSR